MLLRVCHDAVSELLGLGRVKRREIKRSHVHVDADLRRRNGGDVQLGAVKLQHLLQQIAKCDWHLFPFTSTAAQAPRPNPVSCPSFRRTKISSARSRVLLLPAS